MRRSRHALRDEHGAAAVEFVLVAGPFIFMILVALQTAIIFFFDQTLQTATQQSARLIMTGQTSAMNQSDYHAAVCAHLPSMFDCSKVWVDVQSAPSFAKISTAPIVPTFDPSGHIQNTWNFSQGAPSDVVILRVMYEWPVVGGAFGYANQPNGNHLMMGTAVFKNEPFGSGLL